LYLIKKGENMSQKFTDDNQTLINPIAIAICSGFALATGIVIGLLSAKKPGKDLIKDTEKEFEKFAKNSEKQLKVLQQNANKFGDKIKDATFNKKNSQNLNQTLDVIRTKTEKFGSDIKKMISQ
jgi:gas vesicle protein